jgi:hypothetical protein
MIELMDHQFKFEDISAIYVRGKWYEVHDVDYFSTIQIGRVHTGAEREVFWEELNLDGWVKVETPENEIIYFSVNAITGFKLDGPSGG